MDQQTGVSTSPLKSDKCHLPYLVYWTDPLTQQSSVYFQYISSNLTSYHPYANVYHHLYNDKLYDFFHDLLVFLLFSLG
jgi:hypothetical protein